MVRRAASGAKLARRPLVVKLVADEAFERARRSGAFDGTLEEFQHHEGGPRIRALRATRTAALRRAALVVSPSAYLREIALGWGLDAARVVVVPNPAPGPVSLPPREQLRTLLGVDGLVLACAGRLTAQKALHVAVDAVAEVPRAQLLVRGDGPERAGLEAQAAGRGLGDRIHFLGPGTREDVLRLFAAADAVLLTSAWENLPHTVLEALAVGTPVIATSVGGVPEVVHDGDNGLLVPPGDAPALAAAIRRLDEDDALRRRLRDAARPSVVHLSEERVLSQLVELLDGVMRA
jgi:glycosyltransferase involved in cell wall biosynthesis